MFENSFDICALFGRGFTVGAWEGKCIKCCFQRFPESPCLGAGSVLHYFKDSGSSPFTFTSTSDTVVSSAFSQGSMESYFMLLSLS